jgi:hypothetical protein
LRLICVGDVALSGPLASLKAWSRPVTGVNTEESTSILLNWEFPFADSCVSWPRPSGSRRRYVAPLSAVELLRGWAPTVAALANNHLLDGDVKGVFRTIELLERIGISTVGGGTCIESITKPWIWEGPAGKVGILNWVTPETHPEPPVSSAVGPNLWPGDDATERQIACLRKIVNWVVVYIHWSDELFPYPRPADRALAKKLVEWGADAVIGNHSHVVRGFEEIHGRPVFYSLGNYFFSDVSLPEGRVRKQAPRNREALVVELNFKRGQNLSWQMHSYWRNASATYPDCRNRALRRLRKTSLPLSFPDYDEWYNGKRAQFERWGKRLHFRLPAIGWRGVARWLLTNRIKFVR